MKTTTQLESTAAMTDAAGIRLINGAPQFPTARTSVINRQAAAYATTAHPTAMAAVLLAADRTKGKAGGKAWDPPV